VAVEKSSLDCCIEVVGYNNTYAIIDVMIQDFTIQKIAVIIIIEIIIIIILI